MIELSSKQRRHLRSLAHHRRVAVSIGGAGLSDVVLAEIETALGHHELLKIKLPPSARSERAGLIDSLCRRMGAAPVQLIGRVAVIYRPAVTPRIALPDDGPQARTDDAERSKTDA